MAVWLRDGGFQKKTKQFVFVCAGNHGKRSEDRDFDFRVSNSKSHVDP